MAGNACNNVIDGGGGVARLGRVDANAPNMGMLFAVVGLLRPCLACQT